MSAEEVLAVVARVVREPGFRAGLRSGDATLLNDYVLDDEERTALLAPAGTALDEFAPAAPPVYLMPRKEDPTASMTFEFEAPAPRRRPAASAAVTPDRPAAPTASEAWPALISGLVQNLARVIVLEKDGVEATFDGFRLRPTAHPAEPVAEIKKPARPVLPRLRGGPSFDYQPLQSVKQSAPLVELMHDSLVSLLSLVELTNDGQPVAVDAFQLRRLEDWAQPGDNPDAVLRYLSSACQIACEFCYQLGNPPPLRNIKKRTAESEITTRLRHFEAGEELFYQNVFDSDEVLNHPRAIEFLRRVRQHSKRRYTLVTNGTPLVEQFVKGLAEVQPVDLVISLNALDHQVRWEVLRDRDLKQRAVNCLPILERHQVPYVVSLVAWPTVPLHDLEVASEFADQHGAAMIRVNLPGYSKFFSQFKLFDTWEYWPQVTDLVRDLRKRISTPIFISPALYEEMHYGETLNGARILGTVRNSPAERAGIQYNDTLIEVNGVGVESRGFAKALLNLAFAAGAVSVKVRRGAETVRLDLPTAEGIAYPYEHHPNSLFGVVMGDGLSPRYMRDIASLIAQEGARDVVIATSTLAKPALDELLPRLHALLPPEVKVGIGIPANNFLGGNIMAGDLMQVDDFVDFVREWSREHGRPDLVLIPSSPFDSYGWKRDMMGRVFLDIERATGVPVRLIRNDRIWY